MDINDYKEELKRIIDATNDEAILKHWKTHLEWEFEQYQQKSFGQSQSLSSTPSASKTDDKDDTSGYVILESGLGIDE